MLTESKAHIHEENGIKYTYDGTKARELGWLHFNYSMYAARFKPLDGGGCTVGIKQELIDDTMFMYTESEVNALAIINEWNKQSEHNYRYFLNN